MHSSSQDHRRQKQRARELQASAATLEATAREVEAQARYARIRDMYERRVVAKATYDEASAGRDAAVARLVAARAGLDAAREGVSYTEIRAPYAGVMTRKHVEVGEAARQHPVRPPLVGGPSGRGDLGDDRLQDFLPALRPHARSRSRAVSAAGPVAL